MLAEPQDPCRPLVLEPLLRNIMYLISAEDPQTPAEVAFFRRQRRMAKSIPIGEDWHSGAWHRLDMSDL